MLTREQKKKLTFLALKGMGLILLFGFIGATFWGYFFDTVEKKHWVTLIFSTLGFVTFCFAVWSAFVRGLRGRK